MAVALSPWQPNPVTIARLQAAIAGRAAENYEVADALGALASARVEHEAPGAPQAVRDEALLRFAGHLAHTDFGTIRKETIGPQDLEYVVNHANAWRSS